MALVVDVTVDIRIPEDVALDDMEQIVGLTRKYTAMFEGYPFEGFNAIEFTYDERRLINCSFAVFVSADALEEIVEQAHDLEVQSNGQVSYLMLEMVAIEDIDGLEDV